MSNNHQYIIFSDAPRTGSITESSLLITNQLFQTNNSVKQWRKITDLYNIHGKDYANNDVTSEPVNYRKISEFIRDNGYIDSKVFNLPEVKCFWLDSTLDAKINFHVHDHTAPEGLAIADGFTKQIYGDNYPITPKLIREGHTFTTLQPQLMSRIVKLRNKLINESSDALTDDWFFDLRTLISDGISLLEITLHQIYIKAEYAPLQNWTFDSKKLGLRYGRKFEDKLGWIYKISGNHIGGEAYLNSVNNLRELRNHMMHFDPPTLVITLEEATIWLNQIIDIGWLLVKIRKAIGAEVSYQLINFILQREAIFNPEPHFVNRLPIGIGNADYDSCRWKKTVT